MQNKNQQPYNSVADVFGKVRDIDAINPYHLDGDINMYTPQNIKLRQSLALDIDIRKQIQDIVNLYKFDKQNYLYKDGYQKVQRQICLILRPDIEEDQLKFVLEQDWQHDQKDNKISKQDLGDKIYQLVDVWSIGCSKEQYISFIRLLKKKIVRALKIKQ